MFPNLSHSLPLNKYKIQNIVDFFQIIRSFHEKGSSYISIFTSLKSPKSTTVMILLIKMKKAMHKFKDAL